MRPFGCLVTILNTIDHLGKFDGKANEGFFVRYSINSKAFRVFNSRTKIVEENMHVQFSENTPNIARSTKACDDAGKASMETVPGKDYILLPLWPADLLFSQCSKSSPDDGFKPSGYNEKKVTKELGKEGGDPSKKDDRDDQEKDDNINSTNNVNTASDRNSTKNVNTVSSIVNAAGIEVNVVGVKTSIKLPNDPNMPALEDIVYSDNDEYVGVEANMNNLDAFMPASPIPTTRVHKDHPTKQIIGDFSRLLMLASLTCWSVCNELRVEIKDSDAEGSFVVETQSRTVNGGSPSKKRATKNSKLGVSYSEANMQTLGKHPRYEAYKEPLQYTIAPDNDPADKLLGNYKGIGSQELLNVVLMFPTIDLVHHPMNVPTVMQGGLLLIRKLVMEWTKTSSKQLANCWISIVDLPRHSEWQGIGVIRTRL
ncbi:ribonuclease H-like domain-containing protein [Tanacetum coccineum]